MPVSKRVIKTSSTGDRPAKALTGVDAKVETAFTFLVNDAITASVQVAVASSSGSGSRSSWAVRVSNDGSTFAAPATGEITVAAGAVSDIIDVTGHMFVRVTNAAADGGSVSSYTTESVNISVCLQS